MLVTVSYFRPSIIFLGKAGTYPSGDLYETHSIVKLQPWPQIIVMIGIDKHSSLLLGINYHSKSFIVKTLDVPTRFVFLFVSWGLD